VTRFFLIRPIFEQVAKTVAEPKNAKISMLKIQKIYIQLLLKCYKKPCFAAAYLG
jgi:hypothetical protein